MIEKLDGQRVGSGEKNSTNSLTKESLGLFDIRIRRYKFVRVGNTIGFAPADFNDHVDILMDLRKEGLSDTSEDAGFDAGLLEFGYFNRKDRNKPEINLRGGSNSFWIEDDENREARKITRELVKKVIEGTEIGLHSK